MIKMTIGNWILNEKWVNNKKPTLFDTSTQSRWYQDELERYGPRVLRTAEDWDERLMEWLLD